MRARCRAQIQPSLRQGLPQHHRGQKVVTSTLKLPRAAGGEDLCSDSVHPAQHIWPQLLPGAGHSHGAPGSFPSTSPWCSTQDIGQTAAQTRSKASYTPHHKAAEELTPAFSFSSVYISVKYIIYSSIGLIVIYYSLELLLSFPYFNHIYASNFAYTSYCLEFVIEIHRIKLK